MFFANSLLILAAGLGLASAQPLAKRAVPRTESPAGCVVVRQVDTKSGEHSTINAALTALGTQSTASACIFVYSGTYNERLVIEYKGPLTIYGYTEDARSYERNTVTVWNNQTLFTDYNFERTATIVAKTTSFSMHNLEVWNTDRGTQSALAIAAGGNKQAYYGVAIRGHRSVLQANDGDQYYSNCYSEGSSSYIWGNAAAWFDQCTIASNATGYIADSTRASETDIGWFVFKRSRVVAAPGADVPAGSVWLGRAYTYASRVTYQNSELSGMINPLGWDTFVTDAKPKFYEFKNTGDGSDTSQRQLLTASIEAVTQAQIWPKSGTDWIQKSN